MLLPKSLHFLLSISHPAPRSSLVLGLLLPVLLFLAPQVSAANLGLTPATTTLSPNQTTTITVGLNTGGKSTVGADTHINFNSSLVEIQSISFSGSPYPQNFSTNTGSILKLTSSFISPSESYSGATNIATITVKALAAGTANFSFVCTSGATNDTNIVERLTGTDLVDCGTLNTAAITITSGSTNPSPTPTNSPTPTPTATPNNNSGGGTCYSPSAPTNLRSAPYTSDSILLTWDHSISNPTHYTLTYGPSQNQLLYTVGNIGYTNNFLVSYLSPNSTYAFGVAAVNSCGQSGTIFTLNKTLASATTQGSTIKTTPTPLTTKSVGFGNLATGTKKGDTLGETPTKIAKGDENTSPSPTPGPYTYEEPVAKPQTRTIALAVAILIPILLLLWFIFGRRKKKEENVLDQNELNMPPIETLTPPPTPTSTYSNLNDPQPKDNPNDTQIN